MNMPGFQLRYDLAAIVQACHTHTRAYERYAQGRIATPQKNWPADGSWNPPSPLVKWVMAECGVEEEAAHEALAVAEWMELTRRHDGGYGEVLVLEVGRQLIGD